MTTQSVAVPLAPTIPAARVRHRVDSVDVVRGVIMILMALDHTRDFFGGASINPTDLATTTPQLFFTRWITHFCAPVFCLLTGTAAYLARRNRTTSQLSGFLFTRGLWLVFLELTISRFLWQFNVDYKVTIITVLWALGWSMVVLAAL
ncbi:MAG TPA: heparan-alpha-glucosaminide N-acetyltransferase domain-containing protein, partial [Longimicrobium sp.]